MKEFVTKVLATAAIGAVLMMAPARTDAAVLTINDNLAGQGNGGNGGVWTLSVTPGMTAVTLSVTFAAGRAGQFLDQIQWDVDSTSAGNVSVTNAGTSLTAVAGAGNVLGSWAMNSGNINNGGNTCNGGGGGDVCGNHSGAGLGPIVAGQTLSWTFNAVWSSAFTTIASGNIRAAFTDGTNNNNNNTGIFSPGGGTFTTGGATTSGQTTTTGPVPEPTALALLGAAMVGAAYRLRRRA